MAEIVVRDPNAICSHCGLCRNVCPVYKALKDEIASPRAKNISIDAFMNNEVKLDGKYFFEYCNGCEACIAVCPIKCGFDVIKAREYAVKNGFVSKENQEMVEKIEKYRNPFGEMKDGNSIPDKLYCC